MWDNKVEIEEQTTPERESERERGRRRVITGSSPLMLMFSNLPTPPHDFHCNSTSLQSFQGGKGEKDDVAHYCKPQTHQGNSFHILLGN